MHACMSCVHLNGGGGHVKGGGHRNGGGHGKGGGHVNGGGHGNGGGHVNGGGHGNRGGHVNGGDRVESLTVPTCGPHFLAVHGETILELSPLIIFF